MTGFRTIRVSIGPAPANSRISAQRTRKEGVKREPFTPDNTCGSGNDDRAEILQNRAFQVEANGFGGQMMQIRIEGAKESSWEGSLDYGSVARFVLSGDLIFKGATEATNHMGSSCVQQDDQDRDIDLVFQFHWERPNLGRRYTDDGMPEEILTGLRPVGA